jgi:hypothetical protein
MTRKIFTNNVTWLILGAFSFFIGKTITGVSHTFGGMVDDRMLPFTFIAIMNFIMGGYVRAKYHESGPDQKMMLRAVNWSSVIVCLLMTTWLATFLF